MPVLNMFGVPFRHCINGITKYDKVNIDSIPSLNERITDLENDKWIDANYGNYESFQNLINSFYTTDNTYAKDLIIEYKNGTTYKTFLIKKGSNANIDINFVNTEFYAVYTYGDNHFRGDYIINTKMNVNTIIRSSTESFNSSIEIFCHDKDQTGSLTGTFSSGEFSVPILRNSIKIFYKNE